MSSPASADEWIDSEISSFQLTVEAIRSGVDLDIDEAIGNFKLAIRRKMIQERLDELDKQPHFDNDQFVYIENRKSLLTAELEGLGT